MSSKSSAKTAVARKRPAKKQVPAGDVQTFRNRLQQFLSERDDQGRKWADAKYGVYAFYDYSGEPIYVGQSKERLRTRIQRHLTNQRTDAVAMRILDVFEVASVRIWPLWDLENTPSKRTNATAFEDASRRLDAAEYTAYLEAIERSRFGAILNEKIPPVSARVQLPPSLDFQLIDDQTRTERGHADVRIARRAETLSRLAAVARERGQVSDGLRRVLVIQAARLALFSAERLAEIEGREAPEPSSINMAGLVGSLKYERSDPNGRKSDANDASV
ncbi:Excinuclease ABC subunit C [Curtobacterium sp. 8I-2]|nr:Excinuclease ABC subunit C [Curtobacterium sp. 8I-2]